MDLTKIAQKIFDSEKTLLLSKQIRSSHLKFLLFAGEQVAAIPGRLANPQNHPVLSVTDQITLAVKLAAAAFKANAVLTLTEAWLADRCHHCGHKGQDNPCKSCSGQTVAPVDNKFRKEILMACLSEKSSTNTTTWTAEIIRDSSGEISDLITHPVTTEPMEGRLVSYWQLMPGESISFMANYPAFCKVFGATCPPDAEILAEAAKKEPDVLVFDIQDINTLRDEWLSEIARYN